MALQELLEGRWLALTLVIGLVLSWLIHRMRTSAVDAEDHAFAVARRCEPPRRLRYHWPLALDLISQAFRAASSGHILQLFDQLVGATGNTFEQVLLGISGIDTIDPDNIEAVLSTHFRATAFHLTCIDFSLGVRRQTFFPLLGDGIFTQDGPAWKHSRDLLRPQFLSNRNENFVQIEEATQKLLQLIPEHGSVDLQPLFFRFTLETTTFLLFGKSIGALDQRVKNEVVSKEADFADAFTVAQEYLAKRGRLGDVYWLIGGPKFRTACKTVHEFVDSMIETRLKASKTSSQDREAGQNRYVFLDAILQETQDVSVLRSQLLNVLLAGRDTTACCLSWTFRLLARHPDVLSKLRAEIEREVGSMPPTQQHLKKMTYLSYIIKEVLRLYPSVPVNSRTALRRTTLPTGGGPDGKSPILIKRGTPVGYCAYLMHRRKDLFGADARDFRPERWEGGLERSVGWGYVPFNGGPRVCLGQEFAILEASYVIVRLVQAFPSILPCAPGSDEVLDIGSSSERNRRPGDEAQLLTLVLSSAEGAWVKMGKVEERA